MKKKMTFATLFIALSIASAPTIANAGSIGDSVFSWPSELPQSSSNEKKADKFGSTAALEILKPKNKTEKSKKK